MVRSMITIAALAALLSLEHVGAQDATNDAPTWTDDEVAVARLCASERSFAPVDDCPVIASIIRRLSRSRGESVAAYVARVHWRHMVSRRPWVAELSADVRAVPPSWPSTVPWETRGMPAWLGTLGEARRGLTRPVTCAGGNPITWGGRTVDAGRIARMTAPSGAYKVVECGHTANTFLARR